MQTDGGQDYGDRHGNGRKDGSGRFCFEDLVGLTPVEG